MLIEINLAPGATAGGLRRRWMSPLSLPSLPSLQTDLRGLGLGAGALLLLLAIGYGVVRMSNRAETLEAQIQQEVTDSTRYAGMIELVTALQARQDTMAQKIDVIRSVDSRRYVWPHLMQEISFALPAYTWLTEIQTTAPTDSLDSGPAFVIQGNAGSTQALTRFMKNLESSAFVRDVTLVTSEQEIVEGRTIQRFAVEAKYRVPGPDQIQTVPIVVLE